MTDNFELGKQALQLVPEVYGDLAKESVQKVGKALAFVVGALTFFPERGKLFLDDHIKKYSDKLTKKDDAAIVPVAPELALPILERLRGTRSGNLADLFIELLLKGSLKESQGLAHPSYYEVTANISADEAKILRHLSITNISAIPFIDILLDDGSSYHDFARRFTIHFNSITLDYPDQITFYIDNLMRLGILEDRVGKVLADKKLYEAIRSSDAFTAAKTVIEKSGNTLREEAGALAVTQFGRGFLSICVSK